jgi:hypothetical protein
MISRIWKCRCDKQHNLAMLLSNTTATRFWIECDNCGKSSAINDTEEKAITHWNKIAKIV